MRKKSRLEKRKGRVGGEHTLCSANGMGIKRILKKPSRLDAHATPRLLYIAAANLQGQKSANGVLDQLEL